VINAAQRLHFDGQQLYTTFHGRPETTIGDVPDGAAHDLVNEMCRRFNHFREKTRPVRWITTVAIKYAGTIYQLPRPNRHHDVIRHIAKINGVGIKGSDVQGFMTNRGDFVNRTKALRIALAAGQVLNPDGVRADELFSEDLWL
jgi:hypothetical protein